MRSWEWFETCISQKPEEHGREGQEGKRKKPLEVVLEMEVKLHNVGN